MLRSAINCVVATLTLCAPALGKRHHVRPVRGHHAHVHVGLGVYGAVGDSLALGFGEASGFETRAVVGEPSCPHGRWPGVVNMVPAKHFKFLLISAGTNDVPGKCVEAIRAKANADQVMWVIPVNGARQHVLSVAHAHHDRTLSYTPDPRHWPHPKAYWNVLRKR